MPATSSLLGFVYERFGLSSFTLLLRKQHIDHETIIISVMDDVKAPDGMRADSEIHLSRVDRDDSLLLHEQVAAEIRRAIADGEAVPGEKIPQAKDLAAVLGVNTNTVLRALRTLRDEGLLEMGRGRAITVAGGPEKTLLVDKARELITFSRSQGYHRDELVALIQQLP